MKNFRDIPKKDQIEFLNSIDHILSDMDGVLFLMSQKFPDAFRALNLFKKMGKSVRMVSNNSLTPIVKLVGMFKEFGVENVRDDDFIIPPLAVVEYLKEMKFGKKIYLLGTTAFADHLKKAGFNVVDRNFQQVEESHSAIMRELVDDLDIGAVIVDVDVHINFIGMQKSVTYLRRPEVLFLSGAFDRFIPGGPNYKIIGPKYFLQAIEDTSGRKPLNLAKPSSLFKTYAIEKIHKKLSDPSKILFIGDSPVEDMGFAAACGYKKLLVLTGNAKLEDISNWVFPDENKPDYYIENLGKMCDVIENLNTPLPNFIF